MSGLKHLTLLMLLQGLALPASRAQSSAEQAALGLADQLPEVAMTPTPKGWQGHAELAWGQARSSAVGAAWRSQQRQSLALQADVNPAPAWRLIGVARLDRSDPAQAPYPQALLSLQEAYASWRSDTSLLLDLGRVNARQGLGTGYNPSDFLRAGALRSQISVDPASLKTNRLGTVMLRAQGLWEGGALSALLAPKLAEAPSRAGLSLDLGASNERSRWLLAWSQRWSEDLQPQWLLAGADGQTPQLGLNISSLAGQAGLLYLEWAGGRAPTQQAQALGERDAPRHWQQRLATGLRYTAANKLTLTLEWAYDSAAPGRADWQRLQTQAQAYAAYRVWAQRAQELSTRSQWGLYANWPDALGLQHLDLGALLQRNSEDHSRLAWLELRYRWPGLELALQYQSSSGHAGSVYAGLPLSSAWQLGLRGYF
ncbi:hypothetical protein [Paucibacter soli]|uniref:hypothetical protein n=1 Tax=Paucibacter soli TaxID=3133433 RepID=UPI0030B61B70